MKPLRALLLYLVLVMAGAALLSPWLWQGVQTLAHGSPRWAGLARQPFYRYVNRCLLGLAVVGLWPLLRSLRANSWRSVGADAPRQNLGTWAQGALLGWVSLGFAAMIAVTVGARSWNTEATSRHWLQHTGTAVVSALTVSVLEELLFRGAVFTALRRLASFPVAAAFSSGLYAFVHFFQKPENPTVIDAWAGWHTLGQMLRGFIDLQQLIPGLLSLALAGYLLAFARERTGRIWLGVGLHAGWIFWLKSYSFATRATPGTTAWFWGSSRLYDGWLALGILLLTGGFLNGWLKRRTVTHV